MASQKQNGKTFILIVSKANRNIRKHFPNVLSTNVYSKDEVMVPLFHCGRLQ